MYLVYDVLRIRKSSLANKLLLERRHWPFAAVDIASLTEDQLRNALNILTLIMKSMILLSPACFSL
jgi:hypothetical protein